MEPQDNIQSKENEYTERLVKAQKLMRSMTEKFPHEARTLGMRDIPKSTFVILQTPILGQSDRETPSGDYITVETSKHLIVSQNGVRVLEFRNPPNSNPDISEESFKKTFSNDYLQDPRSFNPESKEPYMPYYTPDYDNERITLFNKFNQPLTIQLGNDINQFVTLRTLEDGELENFIETSTRVEQEKTQSDTQKDISDIDRLQQLLQ